MISFSHISKDLAAVSETIQIIEKIDNKLGKALKKHNFIKISKKTGYVYAVKELTHEEVDIKNKELEKE